MRASTDPEQALLDKFVLSPMISHVAECKVANVDFCAFESQAFHLDMENALSQLYSPKTNLSEPLLRRMATQVRGTMLG